MSATTLSALCERVQMLLMDPDGRVWPAATLEEGIRQALGQYRLAGGVGGSVTLAGLDGAAATSLPPEHDSLLALGAAGYAAAMRAVDRVEGFDGEDEAPALLRWSADVLGQFERGLAQVFPGAGRESPTPTEQARMAGLRASLEAPWGAWEDGASW